MYCRNYILGPLVMSLVERFTILSPYLGESAIRVSTACSHTIVYFVLFLQAILRASDVFCQAHNRRCEHS